MSEIELATLGRTGIQVTRLGFGSLNLGGAGTRLGRVVEPATAERLLNRVLDAGINFIDTAPDYGEAEEVIGRAIAHRRSEYVLASKCGCPLGALAGGPPPPGGPRPHDYAPANIRAGVEQSLRRLRTEHLDLVQIHNGPSRAELEATGGVAELLRLRDEGKIRWIGTSSTLPELLGHLQMGVFDVIQVPYSAFDLTHGGVIAEAGQLGMGVVVRGGVAQGSLATPPDDVPAFRAPVASAQRSRWGRIDLAALLDGMSAHEFVLRFALSHPEVSTMIVGTSNPAHLEQNLAVATRGPLPHELYVEALRRLQSND